MNPITKEEAIKIMQKAIDFSHKASRFYWKSPKCEISRYYPKEYMQNLAIKQNILIRSNFEIYVHIYQNFNQTTSHFFIMNVIRINGTKRTSKALKQLIRNLQTDEQFIFSTEIAIKEDH